MGPPCRPPAVHLLRGQLGRHDFSGYVPRGVALRGAAAQATLQGQAVCRPAAPPPPAAPSPNVLRALHCRSEFPTYLQSFLDDEGNFVPTIDLSAYSKATGTAVTNGIVQEIADLIPGITSLNINGSTLVTDVGLWYALEYIYTLSLSLTHALSLRCSSVFLCLATVVVVMQGTVSKLRPAA